MANKPIAQTFYINENPQTGSQGVYITKVDIWFKSKGTAGIELQIRTTENGAPTPARLGYATKILPASSVVVSDNADNTLYTRFQFDTPVLVQAGKSYALVLIPQGGDPNYKVWTTEIGQTDLTTNQVAYTNNETGDLFLSSNDLSWTPVINEDMKFRIYRANFTASTGTAILTSPSEDYLLLSNINGAFGDREPLFPTNGQMSVAVLNISTNTGPFGIGDIVYQTSDGTSSGTKIANGVVYSSNTSVIKVQNTTASFSVANVYNYTNPANAVISSLSQNVVFTSGSNTINVPDSSLFTIGNLIYVTSNTGSISRVYKVSSTPTSTTLTTTYWSTNNENRMIAPDFSDNSATIGTIKYNGDVIGGLGAQLTNPNNPLPNGFGGMILDSVSANGSASFANCIGERIIGYHSGASATIHDVADFPYNQISPTVNHVVPANTNIYWDFKGTKNDAGRSLDNNYVPIIEGNSNEFGDYERILVSRSNELAYSGGVRSTQIRSIFTTENSKMSPAIDINTKITTLTRNLCEAPYQLSGYYLHIDNLNGSFANGDLVIQNNANTIQGTVAEANSTFIRIINTEGSGFVANNTTLQLYSDSSTNATITFAEYYSETLDNGLRSTSRYISKNVLLAQDTEDVMVYLGAYRPSITDFKIFMKITNANDSEIFDTKVWSPLREIIPNNSKLYSNENDLNDFVELQYNFLQSYNLDTQDVSCNTTSANVSLVSSTEYLTVGNYVYITNEERDQFNIRKITAIDATDRIVVLDSPCTFEDANSAFGYIPGMLDKTSAFLYDLNFNIVRYVTQTDSIFDSYNQFAVKIVPVSGSTSIVPLVDDMRVIALQV